MVYGAGSWLWEHALRRTKETRLFARSATGKKRGPAIDPTDSERVPVEISLRLAISDGDANARGLASAVSGLRQKADPQGCKGPHPRAPMGPFRFGSESKQSLAG